MPRWLGGWLEMPKLAGPEHNGIYPFGAGLFGTTSLRTLPFEASTP